MAEKTTIPWTHHSFSPWWGCAHVSPGCNNCFAEKIARRGRVPWGAGVPRRLTATTTWKAPLRWNERAGQLGIRERVFPSMCDPFDPGVPEEWRERFFGLIRGTPHLDWLLLTKRPENLRTMLPADWAHADWRRRGNVWLGVTCEDQPRAAERLELLLGGGYAELGARVLFASLEPLLAPVDLSRWLDGPGGCLDLVIVGAEKLAGSRPGRPCREEWVRELVAQCQAADVQVFVKQLERGGRIAEMPAVDGRVWDQMPELCS